MSEEEKALRLEFELQKAELKKLRDQVNPPPREPSTRGPIDYTQGMSMPRSAMQALVDAVPESVMHGIRADAMKPNSVTGGPNPQPQPQVRRSTGWRDEAPLGPPAGIEHCDRMMDTQDAKDRAELIERELKLAKARMRMETRDETKSQ
jgi:hypothetical protein